MVQGRISNLLLALRRILHYHIITDILEQNSRQSLQQYCSTSAIYSFAFTTEKILWFSGPGQYGAQGGYNTGGFPQQQGQQQYPNQQQGYNPQQQQQPQTQPGQPVQPGTMQPQQGGMPSQPAAIPGQPNGMQGQPGNMQQQYGGNFQQVILYKRKSAMYWFHFENIVTQFLILWI